MHKWFQSLFKSFGPFRNQNGLFQPAMLSEAGLSLLQQFCWYLVRRSRSSSLIECSLDQATGVSVWKCNWPEERTPALNTQPTLEHRLQTCKSNRLFALLHDVTSIADSVVCIVGLESWRGNSSTIAELRTLAETARYLVLCANTTGPYGEKIKSKFNDVCRQLGIHPAFSGMIHQHDQTICCALTGREATVMASIVPAKALALMCVYNEEDVIEETVNNLFAQGLDVFVVDDGSTDSTIERLDCLARSSGRLTLDKDLRKGSVHLDKEILFTRMLAEASSATASGYQWMMTVDADEIRCSPWPDLTLVEAFAHVERMGYQAVDFTVIDFRYAKGQIMTQDSYEHQMRHFEFGLRPGHFLQIKAWRHEPTIRASLFPSRGHEVTFEGRRVFPLKFLLKHYPLRGLEQAHKKIFQNRFPRYPPEELANGAHMHYNAFRDQAPEGWDVSSLPLWDERFHANFLLERLSGIGLNRHL